MKTGSAVTKQLTCAAFAAALALGSAGHVRHAPAPPAQLAPEAVAARGLRGQEAWRAAVEASLAELLPFAAPALAHAPREEGSGSGKSNSKAESKRPVNMQVAQEEIDQLSANLTTSCDKRFHAMMRGEGPALHTFGNAGTKSTEASCTRLNGTICATRAHVVQERNTQDGRSMRSVMDVTGDGCLPSQCTAASDLTVLANFMKVKAQDTIAGMGVEVSLFVDCSAHGGSTVAISDSTGSDAHERQEEQKHTEKPEPVEEKHAEAKPSAGGHDVAKHSSAPGTVRSTLPTLIAIAFTVLMLSSA